jgi:hypothetical protein
MCELNVHTFHLNDHDATSLLIIHLHTYQHRQGHFVEVGSNQKRLFTRVFLLTPHANAAAVGYPALIVNGSSCECCCLGCFICSFAFFHVAPLVVQVRLFL